MYKRLILSLLIFIYLQIALFGQTNNRYFYKIQSNSYQARFTYSIAKTDDGFMWFSNDLGVSRYDGNVFRNYPLSIGRKGYLKKSNKGNLYLCTSNGNGFKYNEVTDTFDKLFEFSNDKLNIINNLKNNSSDISNHVAKPTEVVLTSMDIDQNERIWFIIRSRIYCFNPSTSEYFEFNTKKLNLLNLLVANNTIYLFSRTEVSTIQATNTKNFERKILKTLQTNDNIISSYYDPINAILYWGTVNKGAFCLNNKNEISNIIPVQNCPVRSFKMYDQNTLLVAIDGLGIFEYDIYAQKIIATQKADENLSGTLGSNGIYDYYVDSSKRIWVATYSSGVNVFDPTLIHFNKISHLVNVSNSLYNSYVNSVFEDNNKNLWFGTNNGVSVLKKSDGKWSHFLVNTSLVKSNSDVLTFNSDSKGNVWAGGFGFGLLCFSPNSFKIKQLNLYTLTKESLSNFVFSIYNDGQSLWAVGNPNKLFSINPQNFAITEYPISNIRSIERADENHLLLIGVTNIYTFNKLTGKIDLKLDSVIKQQRKIDAFEYRCVKRSGYNLWIGTLESGLIHYSYLNNSIEVINSDNGLPNNNVVSIEVDNNQNLWLATDDGLCYYNPDSHIIIPLKTQGGSERGLFNFMASVKRSDGTMIFGTKQGAISFDPSNIKTTPARGLLAWTDFVLLNQNKINRKISDILKNPLNKSDKMVLRYDENSFRIDFQELNFNQSILTRYTYQLKGFDNKFTSLSTVGSATFYSLPPGTYEFVVRSFFADEDERYIERSIEIIIRQPWWNSFPAWLLWISIICVSILLIYRYFKKRLERRYSDEKTKFFINVSHDMRTPITLIKAPLSDLLQDNSISASSKHLIHMVNNNVNRLFDMINRILDFEKSDEKEMRLFPQEYDLNDYISEVVENFASYAEVKNITIQAVLNEKSIAVIFDKIKMNMVIENLVSNAIKYSHQGGTVLIAAGNDKSEWYIEVRDNGIGIPSSEQKKIFKRFFRAENAINSKQIGSGMGLLLVNNLTKFMGGNISFESEEGVKTVFRIAFPLEQNAIFESKKIQQRTKEKTVPEAFEELALKPTVLFVDDNDEMRNYISTRLAKSFDIITTSNASDALGILDQNTINIIITDIMMPEISGLDFCEKIKSDSRFSIIPVILLSAMSDNKDILKGLQLGADDYITKPFDSNILIQRIDNILENRKKLSNYFFNHPNDFSKVRKQLFVNNLDKLFIDKLERIFDTNMANPEYTIDMICLEMCMSRTVFYYRMKNLLNISPNDYLRIRRMEKAAELILSNNYTVTQVSDMVGFNNEKYFSLIFSKHFGITPGKYGK